MAPMPDCGFTCRSCSRAHVGRDSWPGAWRSCACSACGRGTSWLCGERASWRRGISLTRRTAQSVSVRHEFQPVTPMRSDWASSRGETHSRQKSGPIAATSCGDLARATGSGLGARSRNPPGLRAVHAHPQSTCTAMSTNISAPLAPQANAQISLAQGLVFAALTLGAGPRMLVIGALVEQK